jgi:hypothetical protein
MDLQVPWINRLSEGLTVKELETVHRAIAFLREKSEVNAEADHRGG